MHPARLRSLSSCRQCESKPIVAVAFNGALSLSAGCRYYSAAHMYFRSRLRCEKRAMPPCCCSRAVTWRCDGTGCLGVRCSVAQLQCSHAGDASRGNGAGRPGAALPQAEEPQAAKPAPCRPGGAGNRCWRRQGANGLAGGPAGRPGCHQLGGCAPLHGYTALCWSIAASDSRNVSAFELMTHAAHRRRT